MNSSLKGEFFWTQGLAQHRIWISSLASGVYVNRHLPFILLSQIYLVRIKIFVLNLRNVFAASFASVARIRMRSTISCMSRCSVYWIYRNPNIKVHIVVTTLLLHLTPTRELFWAFQSKILNISGMFEEKKNTIHLNWVTSCANTSKIESPCGLRTLLWKESMLQQKSCVLSGYCWHGFFGYPLSKQTVPPLLYSVIRHE
jgi:hypothetical protein